MKANTTLQDLFQKFNLERIRINAVVFRADISFQTHDQDAAWELYIEMLTRVVTQHLPSKFGDEKAALESVHTLFPTTREILRRHGRKATKFSKVAIPILNQVVRPFTTKWHAESLLAEAFCNEDKRQEFRKDLNNLLKDLRNYSRMLAEIACVEDMTDLEMGGNISIHAHVNSSAPIKY